MNGFDVYKTYLAVSRHFTTKSYNYNKYRGAVNAKQDTFLRRRDKGLFHRLSKKLNDLTEVRDYFIANYVKRKDFFPTDILDQETFEVYAEWKKRKLNSNDYFYRDLKVINKEGLTIKELMLPKDGALPQIIQLYIQAKISFETLTILQKNFNFLDKCEELNDPLFKRYNLRIRKYLNFVRADWVACDHMIRSILLR